MNNLINFLKTRRSTTAKTMIAGHMKEGDLNDILECGIRVPDHGALNPWFLTVIREKARSRIGKDILVPEYILNNPEATQEDIDFEKNRFLRASIIIAVLYKPISHPKIPSWEMELSTGAVCSNILIAAQSLGYAAQWLTEWYSYNDKMIKEVGGKPETDKLAGFIYIGDKEREPVERRRPKKENVINFLTE